MILKMMFQSKIGLTETSLFFPIIDGTTVFSDIFKPNFKSLLLLFAGENFPYLIQV